MPFTGWNINNTNIFSFNICMEICKEKKDQKLVVFIKLYLFFHGKTFTPTSVTLEIKITDVLNPYFGAFHGLSSGLDWSIWVVKKAGKRFFSIRNFEFKLNGCMHNTINEFGFHKLSFQAFKLSSKFSFSKTRRETRTS